MSLKAFHVVFIVLSLLLALGAGGWGIQQYLEAGSRTGLALGVVFFLAGAALVVYGVRFFGKLRQLGR